MIGAGLSGAWQRPCELPSCPAGHSCAWLDLMPGCPWRPPRPCGAGTLRGTTAPTAATAKIHKWSPGRTTHQSSVVRRPRTSVCGRRCCSVTRQDSAGGEGARRYVRLKAADRYGRRKLPAKRREATGTRKLRGGRNSDQIDLPPEGGSYDGSRTRSGSHKAARRQAAPPAPSCRVPPGSPRQSAASHRWRCRTPPSSTRACCGPAAGDGRVRCPAWLIRRAGGSRTDFRPGTATICRCRTSFSDVRSTVSRAGA